MQSSRQVQAQLRALAKVIEFACDLTTSYGRSQAMQESMEEEYIKV
jgi:hypothetical protein